MLRVRSNIPVILMGETGCGKTSLIKFLALQLLEVRMETINFHAGITSKFIIKKMNEYAEIANSLSAGR
jgi:MoxR-like ATPase